MKIAIIGAGISGCTIYLGLKKHLPTPPSGEEHSITIYEAYDTGNEATTPDEQDSSHLSSVVVGGGLGIGANGWNVLRRLDQDLLGDVVRRGYMVDTLNMKSKNGRVLSQMVPAADSQSESCVNMVCSSRHSLWRCIRQRVPDDAVVYKRVVRVIARPDERNVVCFADGTSPVEADLVIGADGLKSVAKLALFPDEVEDPFPPQYEGLVGVGGFIPSDIVRDDVDKASMNFILGGNGFFGYFFAESSPSAPNRDSPYHTCDPGQSLCWWSTYAIAECPDVKTIDPDDVTRQLRERYKDWKDPVIQKTLQVVRVESMYPTWTVPPLPTWERDGVVLVGDAAHALPPTSGQGVSQALEDVEAFTLFLSHYMRKTYQEKGESCETAKEAIQTAAKKYEDVRLPYVKLILDDGQKRQNDKRDKGVFEEYLMYTFLWVMGWFPNTMFSPLRAVIDYNVAEEVSKVLAGDK